MGFIKQPAQHLVSVVAVYCYQQIQREGYYYIEIDYCPVHTNEKVRSQVWGGSKRCCSRYRARNYLSFSMETTPIHETNAYCCLALATCITSRRHRKKKYAFQRRSDVVGALGLWPQLGVSRKWMQIIAPRPKLPMNALHRGMSFYCDHRAR